KSSSPVRIGNGAYRQSQLDIYGGLLDSVYLYNKYGAPISYDLWRNLKRLLDYVCDNWHRSDQGIWEVRGEPRHFVYSKLMCWVALDRATTLASHLGAEDRVDRWKRARDEIADAILTDGWSERAGAFTQSFGSEDLDASNLMM